AVDPVDDCTFWYTQQYYATTSLAGWSTFIGWFKFPTCGGPAPAASVSDASVSEAPVGSSSVADFTVSLNSPPTQAVSVKYATAAARAAAPPGAPFTVSLPAPPTPAVSVKYTTADGTAKAANGDYVALPLTVLPFAAGEQTKTVPVTVNRHNGAGPNGTFNLV